VTTVQLLLEHGADVNACNAKRGTALANAAHENNIPMIMLLLERGAKINLASTYGSPLSYAAAWAGDKTVKLLLELGAHVEVDSINALEVAIDRGKEDIVRTILHHAVNFNHALARSIVKAAEKGHNGMIDLLLTHGADVNSLVKLERLGSSYTSEVFPNAKQLITPLSEAARLNQRSTAKLLLDRGAKPNVNGGQALQSCIGLIDTGSSSMELLLRYGADVNTAGGKHGSALNAACSKNRIDIVRRFLELNADINAPMSRAISSLTGGKPLMHISQVASTGAHSTQRRTRTERSSFKFSFRTQRILTNIVPSMEVCFMQVQFHGMRTIAT